MFSIRNIDVVAFQRTYFSLKTGADFLRRYTGEDASLRYTFIAALKKVSSGLYRRTSTMRPFHDSRNQPNMGAGLKVFNDFDNLSESDNNEEPFRPKRGARNGGSINLSSGLEKENIDPTTGLHSRWRTTALRTPGTPGQVRGHANSCALHDFDSPWYHD